MMTSVNTCSMWISFAHAGLCERAEGKTGNVQWRRDSVDPRLQVYLVTVCQSYVPIMRTVHSCKS